MKLLEVTPRVYNLLWLFIQHEKGMTIEYIAAELKVSIRSVYSDLKYLKEYLFRNYGVELTKKGKLYSLRPEDARILSMHDFEETDHDGFSTKPRNYQIIEYLATMKTTTLQELADRLYVSKGTINQEMKTVEKLLSKFSINVMKKPYHGIVMSGTELNIRFLLQYMMSDQIESIDGNLENMMFARHLLSSDMDIKLKEVVAKYPLLNTTEMLICLSVMCHRVKGQHFFSAKEEIIETYENSKQSSTISSLMEDIEQALNLPLPDDEVYFLMMNVNNYDVETQNQEYLHAVLEAILKLIKEKYQDIKVEETTFYTGLMVHISTMLKRIKFGKIVRNPVLRQTKESLPFAFNISADIAMMLNNSFKINMNEDEIGLLAMHIQAMMEEQQERHDIKYEGIIASHIGYGNARMIGGRLFSQIPELNIKHQVSIQQMEALLQEERMERKKVIISTAPLSLSKDQYMLVHPIITDHDIASVKEFLKQYRFEEQEVLCEHGFANHIPLEHVYVKQKFKSKEELLSFVCNRLYQTGFVTEEFYHSTLAREKISSTYALNGVALPHGYSKCVKKPGIAIVMLDKPLDWDGYYADMVFVCALSLNVRESDKKIFEDMYTLLNNKEVIKEMKDCKNAETLISILKRCNEGDHDEYE